MLANGLNLNSSVAVASISPQWPHSGPLGLAPGLRGPRPGFRGREVGPGRGAASGRPTRAVAGAGLGVATAEMTSVRGGQL